MLGESAKWEGSQPKGGALRGLPVMFNPSLCGPSSSMVTAPSVANGGQPSFHWKPMWAGGTTVTCSRTKYWSWLLTHCPHLAPGAQLSYGSHFLKKLYIFNYLFLAVLGLHCCLGFSLVVVSGGISSLQCGFSCCRAWTLGCMGSVGAAPGLYSTSKQLWCAGLVALWQVGSSQIRDGNHVSCIGCQVLYHRAYQGSPWLTL